MSRSSLSPLDKLFGKRLLQARHYIMSRKSWLKMVPTENCDIVMTFPGALGRPLLCSVSLVDGQTQRTPEQPFLQNCYCNVSHSDPDLQERHSILLACGK